MSEADNLDIKKRARRRLVGAIALALLAAIVLPLMMEQEPHQSSEDIQISIPDRGETASGRPLAAAGEGAQTAEIAPAPEEEAPSAAAAAPAPAPTPVPTPPPAAKAGSAPALEAAAPKSDAKAAAGNEEARARAALEGRVPPPRAGSFVLQIGAFGDAAVAARVAADLKAKGFAAYTEKSGKFTRVRVGPVSGREAADRIAARLKDAGHNAVVSAR